MSGRRLYMDCDVCGEAVALAPARYAELVRTGQRPRCRRNGCERLCGTQTAGTARGAELLAVVEVAPLVVEWPRVKKGRRNGALAKRRVRRVANTSYGAGRGNG